MTEVRQTDATAETADSTGDAVEVSGAQTVEEVEAYWRNRTSGIQKAHNAETATLHAQMEQMRATPVAAPEGESQEAAQVRELREQLAQSEAARQAEALRGQYPAAAQVLGDEITRLSPEKIAAIETGFDGGQGGPPIIRDPNAARRGQSGVQAPEAKPLNEKTKDELLADLRRVAPMIQAEAREGL